MQSGLSLDTELPVFAFPKSLEFYLEDRRSHKKLLTLYNPYDFVVRFKILCTSPDKYDVSSPNGKISGKCQVDLVVAHKVCIPANCNVTDKFRIELLDRENRKVIGKKDVPATLHSGLPPKPDGDDNAVSSDRDSSNGKISRFSNDESWSRDKQSEASCTSNFFIWLTGVLCLIGLLLPNEGEVTTLPLTVPLNLKLIFAFVLGMVTMVIFRP